MFLRLKLIKPDVLSGGIKQVAGGNLLWLLEGSNRLHDSSPRCWTGIAEALHENLGDLLDGMSIFTSDVDDLRPSHRTYSSFPTRYKVWSSPVARMYSGATKNI